MVARPVICYDVPTTTRFRGLSRRRGMIWRGPAGWAEWSPFVEYGDAEAATWLRAAREMAETGFPPPVRDRVPVNVTVPAESPDQAHARVVRAGCTTAKVKVAEPGRPLREDIDRVAAVRRGLGPAGRIRVDANGAWDVDAALDALRALAPYDLEYAEQPCRTAEQLAEVRVRLARAGLDVPIAADESIRRAGDPERVVALDGADIAVLKVQPLGGVRACLDLAERLGLPVVVSSALETSVGLRAGLALAAALPRLDFACGLNTAALLGADLVDPPLVGVAGWMEVRDVAVDATLLAQATAAPEVAAEWYARLDRVERLLDAPAGGTSGPATAG
jgi:O-succinylbenzoate synthase